MKIPGRTLKLRSLRDCADSLHWTRKLCKSGRVVLPIEICLSTLRWGEIHRRAWCVITDDAGNRIIRILACWNWYMCFLGEEGTERWWEMWCARRQIRYIIVNNPVAMSVDPKRKNEVFNLLCGFPYRHIRLNLILWFSTNRRLCGHKCFVCARRKGGFESRWKVR